MVQSAKFSADADTVLAVTGNNRVLLCKIRSVKVPALSGDGRVFERAHSRKVTVTVTVNRKEA